MKKEFIILVLCLVLSLSLVSSSSLKVTEEHPFLINGKWIEAKDLKIGDKLTTIDGKQVKITSIDDIVDNVSVYNLEAGEYHNFVVGDENLIVHNSDAFSYSTHTPKVTSEGQADIYQYQLLKARLRFMEKNGKILKITDYSTPTGRVISLNDLFIIRDQVLISIPKSDVYLQGSLSTGYRIFCVNRDGKIPKLPGWTGLVPDPLLTDSFYLSDVDIAVVSPDYFKIIETSFPNMIRSTGPWKGVTSEEFTINTVGPVFVKDFITRLSSFNIAGEKREVVVKFWKSEEYFLKYHEAGISIFNGL